MHECDRHQYKKDDGNSTGARQIIIRPVKPTDCEDLQRNCFVRNTLEEMKANLAANIEQVKAGNAVQLVAVDNGAVVGNVILLRKNHPLHAHMCELYSVVVANTHWRRGIARKLINEAVKCAAELGLKLVLISVRGGEPAEQVYRKLGFIEYGRLPGGIVEPWNDNAVYDEIFFYLPT
jgi:predicted N-acetyltransferase YhbS